MIRHLGVRAAAALVPFIPPQLGYPAAALLGDFGYVLARDTRRLVEGNLAVILRGEPAWRVRQATRMAFRNLLWGYYELLHLPADRIDDLRSAGRFEGLEHFEKAALDGGCLIVFAHSGNLEVLSQMPLIYPDERFVVVIEHMPDERMFQLMRRLRASHGLEMVRADEPRRLVEMLRDGFHLCLSGDFDSTGTGIAVDFFGRPARLPKGPVKLALRSGAPLLVIRGWRHSMRDPRKFRLEVLPPMRFEGEATPEGVGAGVQRLARVLEEVVAAQPEQWLAFREVWEAA